MSKRVSVKMPARPDPEALQAFVDEGRQETPAQVRPGPRMPAGGLGAKPVRLNLNMPGELHRRFKTACAAQGMTIAEVVTQLVQEWTDKQG